MKKNILNLSLYTLLLTITILIAFAGCDTDEALNKTDFIGSYSVTEVCNGNNAGYTLTIADVEGSDNAVTITNLWDWEETINATISDNVITFPAQLADEITFAGSGELTGTTLVINYTAVDNIDTENCVATATR